MPAMLTRIVDDLLDTETDMVVVGRSSDAEDSLRLARENEADMLITLDGEGGGTCLEAILAGPALSIFAIGRDGRQGSAISLVRRPIELDTGEHASLAEAIRVVAARP